ncbi:MAG TPA: serine/threonine protein kinase, partial [Polyangiaceae bacterium]|nr:serine/threonine protein kinase [Polyangiaceae bacterium]
MSTRADYFAGLLDLPTYPERPVRRTVFRQSVASLALSTSADGPSPLDGIRPEALLRSIKVAIADGLLEDLSWLAPSAAGVALYEIAAALPLGRERRDIARRVLAQLYEGNASTFVAIASRIAAGSGRGLSGAGVRARVAIVTALPASAHIPVDALAYALTSRRELARDWLMSPSTASLPERRLAGRLLERATREAVRRAAQGGEHALRLFRNTIITLAQPRRASAPASSPDPIASVLLRLLADRETL